MAGVNVVNRFRLFFGLSYGAIGILLPYLALHLTALEFSGGQIGLLLGIIPLTAFLAQPFWGLISDVFHLRKATLTFCCFGVALATLAFGATTDFRLLLLVTIVYAFLNGAINPLANAVTLDYVEQSEGQVAYGSLRLWGSIGFAITSFLVGAWIIERELWLIFPLYSACMFAMGLVALSLPDSQSQGKADWREWVALLREEQNLGLFLFGALLLGATLGIVNNYLVVYLDDIRAAGWVIGAAMAISALAEVPLMANVPAFIERWGLRLVFIGGLLALPLRWFLYLFIEEPLLVLPTQVLHSIAMMSLLVVGVVYMDQQLARKWRASGQALYAAALYGFGPSMGLLAAGQLYEQGGIKPVWLMSLGIALVGTAILNTAVRSRMAVQSRQEVML